MGGPTPKEDLVALSTLVQRRTSTQNCVNERGGIVADGGNSFPLVSDKLSLTRISV